MLCILSFSIFCVFLKNIEAYLFSYKLYSKSSNMPKNSYKYLYDLTGFDDSTFSALLINFQYVKITNRRYILTKYLTLLQNVVVFDFYFFIYNFLNN